jgi:hypothetical protein
MGRDTIIENPVINSAFAEPARHFRFDRDDIPNAKIDEAACSALYSTKSRPFDRPKSGKIAVNVINHYGDEVLKVYDLGKG